MEERYNVGRVWLDAGSSKWHFYCDHWHREEVSERAESKPGPRLCSLFLGPRCLEVSVYWGHAPQVSHLTAGGLSRPLSPWCPQVFLVAFALTLEPYSWWQVVTAVKISRSPEWRRQAEGRRSRVAPAPIPGLAWLRQLGWLRLPHCTLPHLVHGHRCHTTRGSYLMLSRLRIILPFSNLRPSFSPQSGGSKTSWPQASAL